MAQAMEDALRHHWPLEMGDRSVPIDPLHLRLLFVAIAQGVVKHLQEHPDAFKVRVETDTEGGVAFGELTEIQ